MKKGWLVGGIVVTCVVLIVAVIPLLFKGKIEETMLHTANAHLNARLEIGSLRVSLLADFPGATFYLKDLSLIGIDSLENDTIIQIEAARASLNLIKLIGGKYDISQVKLDRVNIFARRLPDGRANWDVIRKDTVAKESVPLNLKLRKMLLNNCSVVYRDEASNIQLEGKDWNGWLLGDFTSTKTVFKTESTVEELSFSINKISYLKNIKVIADASVEVDSSTKKLTFKKSSLGLNHVRLGIDGSVALLDDGKIDYDLKFLGKDITFKDVLSLKPSLYANIYQEIESSGSVAFQGGVRGVREKRSFPSFRFHLDTRNAMFQYRSPARSMKEIAMDVSLSSVDGLLENTILDIKELRFIAGDHPFRANLEVRSPARNIELNGHIDGMLDLGLINELHLWDRNLELSGMVAADVEIVTQPADSVEKLPRSTAVDGHMKWNNVSVKFGKRIDVGMEEAQMMFKSRHTDLSLLNVHIKKSHLSVKGSVENLLGYAMNGESVKGRLEMRSDYFNPKDFSMGGKSSSVFVVPSNVDLTVDATAKKAVYSSLEMTNVTSKFSMKDRIFRVKDFSATTLGGSCVINTTYNTVNVLCPLLNLSLNLNRVSFASTVKSLQVAQLYTPVFKSVSGNYSLNYDFSMVVKRHTEETLAGMNGNGWLRTDEVKVKGVGSLTKLSSLLNIHLFNSFTTKNVYILFAVKDARITTQPFDVNINHVKMNLGGVTGFDQSINYQGTVFFPPYMLIGLVSNVGFKIRGDFGNPQVSLVPVSAIKSTSGKVITGVKKAAEFSVNQTKKLYKKK